MLANKAYYFSHDQNARNDEKILMLRAEHGWEGYGLYWGLIEMMFDREDSSLAHNKLRGHATGLTVDPETLEAVVNTAIEVGLFESDGDRFWSNSLCERKGRMEEERQKRVEGGKKRQAQRREANQEDSSSYAEGELEDSSRSAQGELEDSSSSAEAPLSKRNEMKRNEKKGSKKQASEEAPADVTVVKEYFVERYKELIGCEPMISYGKDMKNLKDMIKTYGVKDMKRAIELYLKDNDKMAVENSHSISFLRTKVGKYMGQLSRGGGKKEAGYKSVDELRKKERKGEAL